MDWGWSEMLWVALISICLVLRPAVAGVGDEGLRSRFLAPQRQESEAAQAQLHDEEIAAIATALKMFRSELHDRESEVLDHPGASSAPIRPGIPKFTV